MKQQNYMVCVSCMTYNHAPYITDALNGFCMQETTFPFVCTIIDDASTDGEQEVIKEYLQNHFDFEDKTIVRNEETDDYILTFARHKTNKNCFFAVLYLKYNHYSIKKTKMPYVAEWRYNCKYIALCEGDDYWIDVEKLKKQVNILENTPNATMVCCGFENVNADKVHINRPVYEQYQSLAQESCNLSTLFRKNFILTLTVLLRKNVLQSDIYKNAPFKYDYALFFAAAFLGDMLFLQDKVGCYRCHSESTIHTHTKKIDAELYVSYQYFVIQYIIKRRKEMFGKDALRARFYILTNILYQKDFRLLHKICKHEPFLSVVILPFSIIALIVKKYK